jgi:phospholipid transport system substrate-binding protein
MCRFFSNSFFNNFLSALIIVIILLSSSNVKTDSEIIEKLNILHNGLVKISKKKIKGNELDFILDIVKKTYDCKKMGRMVVGSTWKEISSNKKKEFIETFEEFIAVNYLRRFRKIDNLEFQYHQTKEIGKKFRLAETSLISDGHENFNINYLFHNKNGGWNIFDVLLDGSISEIATKKSEFSKILKDGGINSLVITLKEKNKI